MTIERINCRNCKYYYITWDPNMPYGCKAFGFKTRQIPSIVVFQSSGQACQGYKDKNNVNKGHKQNN